MLNNFKYIKNIVKHFPQKILSFTSKSLVYFGLAVYWCLMLGSTFLNIN